MLKYKLIQVYTCESARCQGKPAFEAIVEAVRALRIAARCQVSRGVAGCYENGEMSSDLTEILSHNAPLKIEIIVPAAEAEKVEARLFGLAPEGIVTAEEITVIGRRSGGRLLPGHLLVCDVMRTSPRFVHPSTPLAEAAEILLRAEFETLPVVDDGNHPVGILPEDRLLESGLPVHFDLLALVREEHRKAAFAPLAGKCVGDLMTPPANLIGEHVQLAEAVELMLRKDQRCLLVTDASGALCGTLARLDIFRVIAAHQDRETPALRRPHAVRTVGEAMCRTVQTVGPETPLEEVMRLIDADDLRQVAVVDPEKRLLGIIPDRALFGLFHPHVTPWERLAGRLTFTEMGRRCRERVRLSEMRRAGELMDRDFTAVTAETPIDEAVELMTEHRLKRLPVLDASGRLLGVADRGAILRMCLR